MLTSWNAIPSRGRSANNSRVSNSHPCCKRDSTSSSTASSASGRFSGFSAGSASPETGAAGRLVFSNDRLERPDSETPPVVGAGRDGPGSAFPAGRDCETADAGGEATGTGETGLRVSRPGSGFSAAVPASADDGCPSRGGTTVAAAGAGCRAEPSGTFREPPRSGSDGVRASSFFF